MSEAAALVVSDIYPLTAPEKGVKLRRLNFSPKMWHSILSTTKNLQKQRDEIPFFCIEEFIYLLLRGEFFLHQ